MHQAETKATSPRRNGRWQAVGAPLPGRDQPGEERRRQLEHLAETARRIIDGEAEAEDSFGIRGAQARARLERARAITSKVQEELELRRQRGGAYDATNTVRRRPLDEALPERRWQGELRLVDDTDDHRLANHPAPLPGSPGDPARDQGGRRRLWLSLTLMLLGLAAGAGLAVRLYDLWPQLRQVLAL